MKRLLTILILLLPLTVAAQPAESVEGVEVYGKLTFAEERLLEALNDRLIPVPDTIRVEYRERDKGFIQKGTSTIVLSTARHRSPKKASGDPPYLYGRKRGAPSLPLSTEYYTLAHEIAHFLQWQMFNGRPNLPAVMWWEYEGATNPYRIRVETEADLMAAALGRIAFDNSVKAYGFPERIWAGSVDSLAQDYEAAILDFYRVTNP